MQRRLSLEKKCTERERGGPGDYTRDQRISNRVPECHRRYEQMEEGDHDDRGFNTQVLNKTKPVSNEPARPPCSQDSSCVLASSTSFRYFPCRGILVPSTSESGKRHGRDRE